MPPRVQRPSKQALTPAICKKCYVGIVGVLDDERWQQLSGMPEACEVTIDITSHVYGGNIRRRAGSSAGIRYRLKNPSSVIIRE